MEKGRYLVEAHVLGGRPVSELAAAHGVHRSWIYKLITRYREGGYEALAPRSRRPRSCKHQTPPEIVGRIGRAHKNRPIKLLIADRDIRIIDLENGQLIRELTLNPNRDYQPIKQA